MGSALTFVHDFLARAKREKDGKCTIAGCLQRLSCAKSDALLNSVTETTTVVRASGKLTALLDSEQENLKIPVHHFISFSQRLAGQEYTTLESAF